MKFQVVRRTSPGSRAGVILFFRFTNAATDIALKSYRPPDATTSVSWQFTGDLCLPGKEKCTWGKRSETGRTTEKER